MNLSSQNTAIDPNHENATSLKKAIFLGGSFMVGGGTALATFAGWYPIMVIRAGDDPWWYDARLAITGMVGIFVGLIAIFAAEAFFKIWPESEEIQVARISKWFLIILVAVVIYAAPIWLWMDTVFQGYELTMGNH